ncbi:hypothetical protein Hanom_Chr15g01406401 [Helianthus anomalus]
MVHRLFLVLARESKRTRLLPTVLDLRPGILITPLQQDKSSICHMVDHIQAEVSFPSLPGPKAVQSFLAK